MFKNNKTTTTETYESPKVKAVSMASQFVLCQSGTAGTGTYEEIEGEL